MPKGDKSNYTTKQKKQTRHLEDNFEGRGANAKRPKKTSWSAVSKINGGSRKSH